MERTTHTTSNLRLLRQCLLLGFLLTPVMAVGQTYFERFLGLAEEGNASAQALIGKLYANGEGGVPQDYTEAVKWYRLAADQGNKSAQ